MAGLINLKLLTDFFNKIGQKATSDGGSVANPSAMQRLASLHSRLILTCYQWRAANP